MISFFIYNLSILLGSFTVCIYCLFPPSFKTKVMASGPITSWEIDGETVDTVTGFIFLAPESLQMVTVC